MYKKKSELTKARERCDKAFAKLNRLINKKCESCGSPNPIGHHWIEKSRSARLRYDTENIIPLCQSCHCKIHNKFGNSIMGCLDVADIIVNKRGKVWKNKMERIGRETIKVDIPYYEKKLEEINGLIEYYKNKIKELDGK